MSWVLPGDREQTFNFDSCRVRVLFHAPEHWRTTTQGPRNSAGQPVLGMSHPCNVIYWVAADPTTPWCCSLAFSYIIFNDFLDFLRKGTAAHPRKGKGAYLTPLFPWFQRPCMYRLFCIICVCFLLLRLFFRLYNCASVTIHGPSIGQC